MRENDYLFGFHKIGGNAQSIIKDRWVHHTSFLWDYKPERMRYLQVNNPVLFYTVLKYLYVS